MKTFKKILIFVSIISFFGGTSLGMLRVFSGVINTEERNPTSQTQSPELTPEQQLIQQARGYEVVLQREPENRIALEGLLVVRLQMNDLQNARIPLKKLVDLYPDDKTYQELMTQLENELQKRTSSSEENQETNANTNSDDQMNIENN
ncbi:MAG: tetratricopeptide repeat protein [Roseofilum sp. SBFL]|uniref:tetratricopeptide repeat protein n=1 Tax=unclassified Roseofilum TaxID=2620099 RepID=UPI001B197B44|nr:MULTISPECIES: tetratricopeptide repeat protein [unclassified Roseofilum]MBP0015846.1 tetratricopeptide repeat protein [Roseofilum sp. SID3]MBP0025406.1 tetratricopeptide repeat protein [Roseofilum sp. SID2]MBP0038678.1 tetratricopeptide repeat protein [Roseofilum sp. SID1]MBP0043814.1 tetratricopeptide repeat protein [Roseofilum sp. SBFL]